MDANRPVRLLQLLKLAVCVVIVNVTLRIVAAYSGYFPPNFSVDFLSGRSSYFFRDYQWAFYPHIIAGPLTLILGLVLLSDRFRLRYRRWHSRLGRVQILLVLIVLTPSGFWMALYAQGNHWAKIGFAVLAVLTGLTSLQGWRTAMRRQFQQHRLWMTRCYLLLCSAVLTRILGGFFVVSGIYGEWTHTLAAWGTWLVPLFAYEIFGYRQQLRSPGTKPMHDVA